VFPHQPHCLTTRAAPPPLEQTAKDIDGHEVPLSKYAGKVTLVVNVASACGYTDANYKGLMETYSKYRNYGLEVLGFPCNQFGQQESGSETEIKEFCSSKYHVTFPMFSKVSAALGQ
jgi:glutathione peroxidase